MPGCVRACSGASVRRAKFERFLITSILGLDTFFEGAFPVSPLMVSAGEKGEGDRAREPGVGAVSCLPGEEGR